ncbi:hypothetical protein ZEAMMB73_Zm00001d000228 [Zea mays]|nr:hypothetical protein ZEAMMB73_Zm00001d000228 [Zea mays]
MSAISRQQGKLGGGSLRHGVQAYSRHQQQPMANAADDPMVDEAGVEDAFTHEITDYLYVPRYHVLSWMETVEGMVAGVAALPPVYLILNREIFLRRDGDGRGWCPTDLVMLSGMCSRNTLGTISTIIVKLFFVPSRSLIHLDGLLLKRVP